MKWKDVIPVAAGSS